jgi:multisubunit Na+/H+ antiporter MnhB subunit
VEATLRKMWIKPVTIIAWGLLLAFVSGFFALIHGQAFMSGQWFDIAGIKLGTPTLFDLGVYLAVFGVLLTIMVAILNKETKWD